MKANPDRDPFTFSLRGMAAVNSYAMMPAVASDGINRAWDARLDRSRRPNAGPSPTQATQQIEALLARYFAPGCCGAK